MGAEAAHVPERAYNSAMGMQVDAVYENGVLRPLQPLDLAENEHVLVTVVKATSAPDSPELDLTYLENLQKELRNFGPAPGLPEVRRRLAKIPGSMTADFIAEREER
jgi:predicted DNA-binding antitoxin AbrB/MazE fold protein